MNDPNLQLFVDSQEIHQTAKVRRILNQPCHPREPVLRGYDLEVNVETFRESIPKGGSVRVGVLNPDATAIGGYRSYRLATKPPR